MYTSSTLSTIHFFSSQFSNADINFYFNIKFVCRVKIVCLVKFSLLRQMSEPMGFDASPLINLIYGVSGSKHNVDWAGHGPQPFFISYHIQLVSFSVVSETNRQKLYLICFLRNHFFLAPNPFFVTVILGKPSFKKNLFCEKISQTGGGSSGFHTSIFFYYTM